MKLRSKVALLMLVSVAHGQDKTDLRFRGIAINTTNPESPIATPIEITVINDECKLAVALPLQGSGICHIKTFDKGTRKIEIISDGPPPITWIGTIRGNLASGTYTIEAGHQTGSFYLAAEKRPQESASAVPVQVAPLRNGCSPPIESAISGDVEGWDGETIFKLDNGQIWQQAEYDYTYFYEFHPDVTIYSTSGGCRMKVEDEDDTIIVKRIK